MILANVDILPVMMRWAGFSGLKRTNVGKDSTGNVRLQLLGSLFIVTHENRKLVHIHRAVILSNGATYNLGI